MFGTISADPDVLYKPRGFRDLPIQEFVKYRRPSLPYRTLLTNFLLLLLLWLLHL